MNLLILIPIVWLGAMVLLVAVCRAAAIGDRGRSLDASDEISIGPKLALAPVALMPRRTRRPHTRAALARGTSARRLRPAHSGR